MNSINNLPFEQFKRLGLDKKDVLSLPGITLEALLSGKRSQLMSLSRIELGNDLYLSNVACRLGLDKQAGGNYTLRIYTRQPSTPSQVEGTDLTTEQVKFLKTSENPVITLQAKNKAGFTKDMLVQYDKHLNDFVTRPLEPGPHQINGHPLTEEQRTDFATGKAITTPEGQIIKSLNNILGYQASFLVLGAAVTTPSAIVTAIAASVLAMKQMVNTMAPSSTRPYRSYDDSGMVKEYIAHADKLISNLSKPKNMQKLTQPLTETLAKFGLELKEIENQYQENHLTVF